MPLARGQRQLPPFGFPAAALTAMVIAFVSVFGAPVRAQEVSTATALNGGGGVVGEGAGDASVGTTTGSAQFSYRFDLPRARGAVQPALALKYSSAVGDGEAGYGWRLATSAIRRVRNPRAFEYKPDSDSASPSYPFPGDNDRFEWNGQPLVLVCASAVAGCASEESFSPATVNGAYYRLKDESTFARFFLVGGESWVVEYTSGITEYYGVGSGVERQPRTPGDSYPVPVRWHLTQSFDTHRQNVVHYRWSPLSGRRGLAYLTDIAFTPRVGAPGGITSFQASGDYETHVQLAWQSPNVDGDPSRRFPQHNTAPVYAAMPDLLLARVDVTVKPPSGEGPREMLRRYYLTYLEHDVGEWAATGNHANLQHYDPTVHVPLRGHSFLKSIQLEGRCKEPVLESEDNDDQAGALPPATVCPRMPPTEFEYTPRAEHMGASLHPTFPRFQQDTPTGAPHRIVESLGRITVHDVDRDGRPDILEAQAFLPTLPPGVSGSYRVLRNTGLGPLDTQQPFVEDCLDAPSPLTGAWAPFLDGIDGLTVVGPWGHLGQGTSFLWRDNVRPPGFLRSERSFPGHAWGSARLQPSAAPCGGALSAPGARQSWLLEDTPGNLGAGLRPLAPATKTTDGVLLAGDLDGDGIPDGYVRLKDSTTGTNVIRFSRRQLGGHPYGVAPFAERVLTNAEVGRYECTGPSPCSELAYNSDGVTTYTGSGNDAQFRHDDAYRAFVDMNGDGIADFVASSPMQVSDVTNASAGVFVRDVAFGYFPGDGRGHFACNPSQTRGFDFGLRGPLCAGNVGPKNKIAPAGGESTLAVPIQRSGPTSVPTGSPPLWHDRLRPHRPIFFHDINGDGFADMIIGKSASDGEWAPEPPPASMIYRFEIYINDVGVGFHRYCDHDSTGRTCGDADDIVLLNFQNPGPIGDLRISFADVNADGIDEIVVVARDFVATAGITGLGARPGLLKTIRNGRGATTSFEYETYQRHSFDAAPVAENKLEAVTYVVTSVSTHNGLSGTAERGETTGYRYRRPAFDPWLRTFVGFGEVTQVTQHGTTVDEYFYDGCRLAQGCSETSDRSPIPAGLHRASTLYAADPGEPKDPSVPTLRKTLRHFVSERLAPSAEPRARHFTYPSETRTFIFDTTKAPNPTAISTPSVTYTDPEHSVTEPGSDTLWTDDGTSLLFARQTYDSNGNLTRHEDHGRVKFDLAPIDDVVVTTQTPALVPVASGNAWVWRTEKRDVGSALVVGASFRRTRYVYDSAGDVAHVRQHLQGSLPLLRGHSAGAAIAPDPVGGSADGWKVVLSLQRDDFGNVTRSEGAEVQTARGPRRPCHETGFDYSHARLPRDEYAYLDGCGSAQVNGLAVWDRGYSIRTMVLNEGALTTVELDPFGRPKSSWDPSADLFGAQEASPRFTAEYFDGAPVSRVEVNARDVGGAGTVYRRSFAYSDGLGNPLLSLSPGEGTEYIASGLRSAWYGGLTFDAYKSYAFSGDPAAPTFEPPSGTAALSTLYDPFGRPVATYDRVPDGGPFAGELVGQTEYHGLSRTVWDAEDVKPTEATPRIIDLNGHGQVVFDREQFRVSGGIGSRWVARMFLPTGEAYYEVRGSTTSAATISRYRSFDTFGRVVGAWDSETSTANEQRYAYNDAGWLVGTSDARGCGQNLHYDGAGRAIAVDLSPCRPGHATYSDPDLVTGDGTEAFATYDAPEPGVPAAEYGAGVSLAGRLLSVQDRGAHTRYAYDVRGRTTRVGRRIVKPGPASDLLADRYAPHWFGASTTYDTSDRVTKRTTGADVPELLDGAGESAATFAYGARGTLASIGTSYGPLLVGTTLRPDGLPTSVTFGDAAATTAAFAYTGGARVRMASVLIARAAPAVWSSPGYPAPAPTEPTQQTELVNATYAYDAVGNTTGISDLAVGWPAGARPAVRTVAHDSLYRVIGATSATGSDTQTSPFAVEGPASRAVPRRDLPLRTAWQSFVYDALGNVVASDDDQHATWDRSQGDASFDAGRPTRLTATAAAQVHYDESGNMVDVFVHRPGPCEHGQPCNQRFVYDWDEVGQLATARRWDLASVEDDPARFPTPAAGLPARELRYAYSGGQRTLKTAVEADGDVHSLEVFDSLRLNRTTLQDGDYVRTAENEAVYFGRAGRVIYGAADLPGATTAHARLLIELGDHLGSASVILDQETGEVVEKVSYDAIGNVDADYRPTRWRSFREDLRFTEKEEDVEVGLTYFGARYLSTNLGRWISPDPLTVHGWGGDANPYAYVSGRTMSAVDPWGLEIKDVRQEASGGTSWVDTDNRHDKDIAFEFSDNSPAQPAAEPSAPAERESRLDQIVGRGLLPDAQGVHRFPGGYSYHTRDAPAHLANGLMHSVVQAFAGPGSPGTGQLFQAYTMATGRTLAPQAAAEAVERFVKIPVPDRGPGDITRGWVAGVQMAGEVLIGGAALRAVEGLAAAEGVAAEGAALRLASGAGPSVPAAAVRTIAHGEGVATIIEEAKALTYASGNEHALVSLTSGERVLVSGGPGGMSFEGFSVRRILGHTHPYQVPPTGPSGADFGALESLGQRSSWLLEHGTLTRFRVRGP